MKARMVVKTIGGDAYYSPFEEVTPADLGEIEGVAQQVTTFAYFKLVLEDGTVAIFNPAHIVGIFIEKRAQ